MLSIKKTCLENNNLTHNLRGTQYIIVSPLQLPSWGYVKNIQGWENVSFELFDEENCVGTVLILLKRIPTTKYYFAFIPFGPLLKAKYKDQIEEIMDLVIEILRKQRVILLKVHPYIDYCGFKFENWKQSKKMLYTETFIVDLQMDEVTMFSRLHKKLRNEIRKAEKLGTHITTDNTVNGMEGFYKLHKETMEKTNYPIQPFSVFEKVLEVYVSCGKADIKFAEAEGQKISAAIFLKSENVYLYMWGASTSEDKYNKYEGQKYLIWQSMLEAKKTGAIFFDLGGVTENAEKGSKKEGIYTFKSRFGGELKVLPGTFDVYVGNRLISAFVAKLLSIYLEYKEKKC